MKFANPIRPGFYPDPSVCRVGDDYYLVNSTFEYFPGVPIFHSKDLANWTQIGHCLTRPSQLPLENACPSDGIYAPTIRFHAGRFYMATTNMISGSGFRNFYVHTDDPAGEWSEPVWVNQGGIDPSLFFDDDGKVYWTGNGTRWSSVRGIYQSEIDIETGELKSEPTLIWIGTGGGYPEGPHLFKRGSTYYLSVAEGGTSEGHMVTIARSENPFGPFESCPQNPILTHRSLMCPIHSTGHADLFEDHQGNWWSVFLGIRTASHGFHNLGRETNLAPVEWNSAGWPVVNGGQIVRLQMNVDRDFPSTPPPAPIVRDDFAKNRLDFQWIHLRNLPATDFSLAKRTSCLSLHCTRDSLDDLGAPAFAGRRQQHFAMQATTRIEFEPNAENEEAGLTVLIDHRHHAELVVSQRNGKKVAFLRRRVGDLVDKTTPRELPAGPVTLRVISDRENYHFSHSLADDGLHSIGAHEVRYVSTAVAGGYTGVVLGMFASARGTESASWAHFDWFDYEPLADAP